MFKSIASAEGWYFTHPNVEAGKPPIVYKLAMWALSESGDGKPIGLVTINKPGARPMIMSVPPVEGHYFHRDELTQEQLDQLLGDLRSWTSWPPSPANS